MEPPIYIQTLTTCPAGPLPPPHNGAKTRKRRPTSEHDPRQRCNRRHAKGRNGLHKLSRASVRSRPPLLLYHLAAKLIRDRTTSANTSTTNANKRTIPPPAVLEALVDLEFEAFVPRVEAELNKYNEVQVGKRNEYRRKVKEEKKGGVKGEEGSMLGGGEEEEEEGRATKRVRREESSGAHGGGGRGEGGDGHEQLQVGEASAEGEGEGMEEEEEDGRVENEEGDEDEDEEEEEDDEDEYPDEGRRLSSVEREAHEGIEARSPRYDDPNDDEEEDEEGLSAVSD